METIHKRLLVVLFLSIACTCAHGFSIQKRSTDATSSENHLADALKVIQREKRRALYNDLDGRRWRDDVDYYDDWERPYPMKLPRYDPYNLDDVPDLEDLFATDKYGQGDDSDVYRAPPLWHAENDASQEATDAEEDSDGNKAVSEDELEDIFGDTTKQQQQKRNKGGNPLLTEALLGPAGKRAGVKREYDRSMDKKSVEPTTDIKLSDLSPEQVDVLLKAVEEEAKNEIVDDESVDDANEVNGDTADVTDDEINNIFSKYDDDADGVPTGNDASDEDGDDSDDQSLDMTAPMDDAQETNKEWLMSQYLDGMTQGGATTVKKKRSEQSALFDMADSGVSRLNDGDRPADLAMELALAREDIRVMRTFLQQEDDENAHLAHALNLATKSQTERTDKYVPEEVEYIRKAIQDEMDIQEVKDVLHIAASMDDTADYMDAPIEEESPEEEDVQSPHLAFNNIQYMPDLMDDDKRGEPDIFVPDEVDLADQNDVIDDDIASDVTNGGSFDMSDEDFVKVLLAGKLQKMLRQGPPEDLNMQQLSPKSLAGWYNEPMAPSIEVEDNQEEWYLNPLMRELWQKYQNTGSLDKRGYPPQGDPETDAEYEQPMDLNTLEGMLVDKLLDEAAQQQEQEVCPAVEELSTYCSFMNELGMTLDEEAMDLCNRHDMCYTCGSVLDLSPDDCDRGYLEEAVQLCEDKDGCDKDASRLFILMLHYHSYQQTNIPEQCAYQCTQEYIAGSPTEK